jgi:hypothetical protein
VYEECCSDGELESSLVAGLRTGGDPDAHLEERMMPKQSFAYSIHYFAVDSVAYLKQERVTVYIIR